MVRIPTVTLVEEGQLQVTNKGGIENHANSSEGHPYVQLMELEACLQKRGSCEEVSMQGHRVRRRKEDVTSSKVEHGESFFLTQYTCHPAVPAQLEDMRKSFPVKVPSGVPVVKVPSALTLPPMESRNNALNPPAAPPFVSQGKDIDPAEKTGAKSVSGARCVARRENICAKNLLQDGRSPVSSKPSLGTYFSGTNKKVPGGAVWTGW